MKESSKSGLVLLINQTCTLEGDTYIIDSHHFRSIWCFGWVIKRLLTSNLCTLQGESKRLLSQEGLVMSFKMNK